MSFKSEPHSDSVAFKSELQDDEVVDADVADVADGADGADSDDTSNWHLEDEPLKGTEGSRIAAYRALTATWRCYECGKLPHIISTISQTT